MYPPVIKAALGFFKGLDLKFHLEGTDQVPTTGGAVLVSNHISYLDFIFAGLAAHPAKRLVRFMAKKEVFDHKVSGPLMRGMHHIPVDRGAGADSYQAAVEALKGGEVVGVFAELLEKAQREYPEVPKPGETWWQPTYLGGTAPTPEEAAKLDSEEKEQRAAKKAAKSN